MQSGQHHNGHHHTGPHHHRTVLHCVREVPEEAGVLYQRLEVVPKGIREQRNDAFLPFVLCFCYPVQGGGGARPNVNMVGDNVDVDDLVGQQK